MNYRLMSDVLTKSQRSNCMSRIKDRDTKPELQLRRALWARGLRYRLRYKLEGKPDMVLVTHKIAIFVDGCFWHGCPEHYREPRTRSEFWRAKIDRNKLRDDEVNRLLSSKGWRVLRFWEHTVQSSAAMCADEVLEFVKNGATTVGLESHATHF